jgi:Zn-dependent peptidase ImmA (M78 family)/transcriptional regulator with XRE-family HTH domain
LAGASAQFDGARLTLARQLAGLKKVQLAKLIDMTPASVSSWESAAKAPNASAIAKISFALGVEPQFFAAGASAPPTPALPHFRSLRSTTQTAQDQAFAYGRLTADIAAVIEKSVEFPARDLPSYPLSATEPSQSGPEEAARRAREHFGVPVGPVQHLVRLAERAGVLVVFSAPQTASIDAYSLEVGGRPLVVLNPEKDDYYRQRFDVAHELGHLIMHVDAEPGGRIAEEQAQRFAAEFLMPTQQIRSFLPSTTTGRGWQALRQLKEHWGVSMQAVLYRSRSLGIMSEVTYRNAMMRISTLGWRRAEPGNVNVLEMPSLLPRAVEVLSDAGVAASEVIRGRGLPLPIFELVSSRYPRRDDHIAPGASGIAGALLSHSSDSSR